MKNKKYLIVKCEPLNDQYECDANRIPLCLVDNYTEYFSRNEYEIYELQNNNTFKFIQECNV